MNVHMNQIVADKIIAVRTSKTVFQDGDIVLKVFDKDYSKSDIMKEAWKQACAEETDLHIPKCLGILKFEGQWSIVSEYIRGNTLQQLMELHPERRFGYLELFVKLQMEVHLQKAPGLGSMKDKLDRKINCSGLDATTRYELHRRLGRMPYIQKLCHGDFNLSNIILGEDELPYILDWSHASLGDTSADAANTYLIFWLEGEAMLADQYLDLYCRVSDTAKQCVREWIPIIAASRLTDRMLLEKRKLLLNWVNVVTDRGEY